MIGLKFISEFLAGLLLFLLSIVSLSARYAPCHGIKFTPCASLLCVILALRLLTSLIRRNILVHDYYLHSIFGCPPRWATVCHYICGSSLQQSFNFRDIVRMFISTNENLCTPNHLAKHRFTWFSGF